MTKHNPSPSPTHRPPRAPHQGVEGVPIPVQNISKPDSPVTIAINNKVRCMYYPDDTTPHLAIDLDEIIFCGGFVRAGDVLRGVLSQSTDDEAF